MLLNSILNHLPKRRMGRRVNHGYAAHRLQFETFEERRMLSFTPAAIYDVGMSPQAVVTADFNNDGQLDLATANLYDDTVSVLLGNTDGTFQPAQASATGGWPFSLAVGDYNADGKLDLATANYDGGYNNDVSILLGNGDGTFAAPVGLYATEVYPWSIAAGDLNADGNLDLVVTSDDEYSDDGFVSVLLGNGDGTFVAAAVYGPFNRQNFTPVLADFNSDGKVDVAVASWETDSVKLFLGNGNGTFQEPNDFFTGYFPNSVTAGDFNGDGKLDLTTANSGSVSLLLGNGNGTFQTARSFAAGDYPQSATAGDFNGDGKLDLIVTNPDGALSSTDGDVSVLLGNGAGSLAAPITTATGGTVTVSVVMGDFNGDGRPDVAATNALPNTISVLLNDGVWNAPPAPPSPPAQPSISITDVTKSEGNKGKTSFTFTVTLSQPSTQTVTVQFSTADGTATLANRDYSSKTGSLTFLPGQTNKTITVSVRGDRKAEADETFFLNLLSANNALIADGQGMGTILNDDGGSLAQFAALTHWDQILTSRKRK